MQPDTTAHEVFVSYSWDSDDHVRRVLSLAQSLRRGGVDVWADKFEQGSPRVGWPQWCYEQVAGADHVLVACTETYHLRVMRQDSPGAGRGATWEGMILTNAIYDQTGGQNKFIPIVFDEADKQYVPYFLHGQSVYNVSVSHSLSDLYARLTGQHTIAPEPVGQRISLQRTELETPEPIAFNAIGGPSASRPSLEGPPTATRLDDVIEGEWIVDVLHPHYGTQTMRLKLNRSVLGRRRFEVVSVAGPGLPGWHGGGRWEVIAPGNRVAFQGVQRAGYQAQPLMESFTLSPVTRDHLRGTNAMGMEVEWHRH
jgi:hypothetical protein